MFYMLLMSYLLLLSLYTHTTPICIMLEMTKGIYAYMCGIIYIYKVLIQTMAACMHVHFLHFLEHIRFRKLNVKHLGI